MASSKPLVENSLTPLLVANQSLPLNSIDLPAQSLFPLRVALPPVAVPTVNSLPMSPVQQQTPHPTISEPWVLLPTSVLPLSSHLSAAAPTLLPRVLAPEALISHQLQLNQTALPLVMNSCMLQADPSLKTQPLNQQVLLLPVDSVRGNQPPCLDVAQELKETVLLKQEKNKKQSILAGLGGKLRETGHTSLSMPNTGALTRAEQRDQQEGVTVQPCIKLETLVSTSDQEVQADRSDLKANMASQTSALACDTTTSPPTGTSSPGPGLRLSHPYTVSANSSDASSVPEPGTIMSNCISTTCREALAPNAAMTHTPSVSLIPTTSVSLTPSTNAHSALSHLNIAQIISSLPPGWQLVGITGMDKINPGFTGSDKITPVVDQTPMTGSLVSPLTPNSSAVQSTTLSLEVNSLGKKREDTTTIAMSRQVKKNLDPLSPPSVLNTLANRGLEPQFLHTLGIPVKTENQGKHDFQLQESGGEKNQNTTIPAIPSSSGKFDPDSPLRTVRPSQPCDEMKTEVPETPRLASPIKTDDIEARWTIVGVTQLPTLPTTSTLTTSGTGSAIAEMIGREATSCMPTASSDQPQVSTFSMAAVKKTDFSSSTLTSTTATGDKSSNSVLPSSLSQAVGQGNLPVVGGSDDMKWTVVGMVSAAATASSAMNSALFSSPALTSSRVSLTSSSVSLGNLDSLVSNQLINLLPSLSTASLSSVLPFGSLPPMLSPEVPDKSQTHQGGIQSLMSQFSATQSLGLQDLAHQMPATKASPKKQELCQPEHSEPQWTIVGLTQLGLSANSIVPLMPINHLTPVLPMPLLLPSAASSFMPGLPSELASFMLSSSGASSVSSLVSSFPSIPSLFNTPMSSMPVLSLPSTPLLSPPSHSKLLNHPTSPGQLLTLPGLVQQQNMDRLLQDQMAACQGSSSVSVPSQGSQWNVVGIIPNNQVTSSSSFSKQTHSPLTSTEESITQVLPDTSTFSIRPKRYPLTSLGRRKTRGPNVNRSITIRQSLASRRESLENKRLRFKCKDTMKKCHQQSALVKKNTVSSLLKIRRIQQGTSDNESSDGGPSLETLQQSLSDDRVCEIPRKKAKIRSLRSYAGNRKIFTRTQNKTLGVRLSLRSGTQLATSENLMYETRLLDVLPGSSTECQVAVGSLAGLEENNLRTVTKMEAHSSSHRRKLKVPRKLIADVDYHPFDSSSDSN